jgi:hypothetical protein
MAVWKRTTTEIALFPDEISGVYHLPALLNNARQ